MASIKEYPPTTKAFLFILRPTFPSFPTSSLSLSLSLSLSTFYGVAEAMSDEASAATPPTASLWSTVNSWFTPPVLFLLLNLMIGTIAITSQLGSSHGGTHDEHQKDHQEQETQKDPPAPPSARPPSIFQSLKSIIFFWNIPQEQPTWPTSMKAPEMETHRHHPFEEPEHDQRQEKGPEREREQEQENPSHFTRSPSMPQKPNSSGLYSHMVIAPTATPTPIPTGNFSYSNLDPLTHYNFRQEQAQAQEQQEDDRGDEADGGAAMNWFPRTMRRSASVKYPTAHIDEDDEEENGDFLERRRPATAREGKGKISGHADEEVDARADDFINRFKHQLKLQRMESITN